MSNGGAFNMDSMENTFALTATNVGYCEGITDVLRIPDYAEETD